jgi:hypothetical protein
MPLDPQQAIAIISWPASRCYKIAQRGEYFFLMGAATKLILFINNFYLLKFSTFASESYGIVTG